MISFSGRLIIIFGIWISTSKAISKNAALEAVNTFENAKLEIGNLSINENIKDENGDNEILLNATEKMTTNVSLNSENVTEDSDGIQISTNKNSVKHQTFSKIRNSYSYINEIIGKLANLTLNSEVTNNSKKDKNVNETQVNILLDYIFNNNNIKGSKNILQNFTYMNIHSSENSVDIKNTSSNESFRVQNHVNMQNVTSNISIDINDIYNNATSDIKNVNVDTQNISRNLSIHGNLSTNIYFENASLEMRNISNHISVEISNNGHSIIDNENAIEFLLRQEMETFECWVNSNHNITEHEQLDGNNTEEHLNKYFQALYRSTFKDSDWKKLAELGRAKKFMHEIYWRGSITPYYLRGVPKIFWRKKYTLMGFLADLKREFAESRDYNKLKYYWIKWRDVTGRRIRKSFLTYVEISRNDEDWEDLLSSSIRDSHRLQIDRLYQEIMPFYRRIHSYVRKRLLKHYGYKRVHETGPIPEHLLGDIHSENWLNIEDLLRPYPNMSSLEICKNIKKRNISAINIAKIAEKLYVSLGFDKLDSEFWSNSVFESISRNCTSPLKLKCNNGNFGFHACIDPDCYFFSMFHFLNTAEEMKYSSNINPVISEAIVQAMILSATTPEFLYSHGLTDIIIYDKHEEINFLMETAIRVIPTIMNALSLGLWKSYVMSGTISHRDINENFWKHRLYYQGLCPPVVRTEKDFDAGAIKSVTNDLNIMNNFLGGILQFQFHKDLCIVSGHVGPLHRCNLYNSSEAGVKIRKLLNFERSATIVDALTILNDGTNEISIAPLLEYFRPLYEWLLESNKFETLGWESDEATVCPKCKL